MKRKMLYLFVIVMFGSCGTFLGVYDPTVPEEQLVTLIIHSGYTITGFDGNPVEWKGGFSGVSNEIDIPAGKHEITYQHHQGASGGWSAPTQGIRGNQRVTYQTYSPVVDAVDSNITVTIDFEAGYEYFTSSSTIRKNSDRKRTPRK
ncbi:MAG: hypothetical protein LBJ90_04945 [Treponema sp.]|jgi:hypothetical protein|nr:hypothetical protein [Treponema sp.]